MNINKTIAGCYTLLALTMSMVSIFIISTIVLDAMAGFILWVMGVVCGLEFLITVAWWLKYFKERKNE